MTRTLQNWMTIWCGALGLFGLVLVGSVWDATSGLAVAIFEWMDGADTVALEPHLRFILAFLGAVTLGWSLTLWVVFQVANQLETEQRQAIWTGITISVTIWYVIDSALSVFTGFGLNAASNTLFMTAFLIPVIRSGVLHHRVD